MSRGTRYVSAELANEDDFQDRFTHREGEIVYDARTKSGPWAMMTEKSWKKHGIGQLGLGLGQKYQRDSEGRLMKMEG